MTRVAHLVAGTLVVLLAAAPGAQAASVSHDAATPKVVYQGTDAVDDVGLGTGSGKWNFTRQAGGADISDGDGVGDCTATGDSATCPETTLVEVLLEGGDDTASVFANGKSVLIRGGGGSDELFTNGSGSPPATATLEGGSGNDLFSTRNFTAETADGGSGDDTFLPFIGADTIIGGDGTDTLTFLNVTAPTVTISLDDQANDSAGTAGANVKSDVENIVGTSGDDELVGSAGPNRLEGGPGGDTIRGGGGADTLLGGDGIDDLQARDGAVDTVDCGGGGDTATVDVADQVTGCETVRFPDDDGDGATQPGDCNDGAAHIKPGAPEVPENGVDEDCDGTDAVDFDRDRDGATRPSDCNDNDAKIRPGVPEIRGNTVDENCDKIVEPFPRITSGVVNSWKAFARFTQVLRFRIRDVPVGAVAEVRCKGRGCPRGVKRLRSTGGKELRFESYFGRRRLRVGTRIEVRITLAGRIGKFVRYEVRRRRKPRATIRCLQAGATAPGTCPVGS